MRLINTSRWRRLRARKLTEHPLCQRCESEGRIRAATEVHHIVPVENAPGTVQKAELMYNVSNLICLCHDCHVKAHLEMGRGGKAYARRRNDYQKDDFKRKFGLNTERQHESSGGRRDGAGVNTR